MDALQASIDAAIAHVHKELAAFRSGRAAPALVEDIVADAYGAKMPIKQLASISVPEPRTLAITPWDMNVLSAVTKALEQADLGAMPSVHGETIHITLPPLTQERREKLLKLVGKAVEEGRIAFRRCREDAMFDGKKQKENGSISEDAYFKMKEDIDRRIQHANEKVEEMRRAKEEELRTG